MIIYVTIFNIQCCICLSKIISLNYDALLFLQNI